MSSRTEQPTARRLREARRRGEVAVSRDLTSSAALAGGLAALAAVGASSSSGLARMLRESLCAAFAVEPTPAAALAGAALAALRAAAPPMAAAAGAAALLGLAQTRFLLVPGLASPRLERLDPVAGLRRIFSARAWQGALLGLLRAAVMLGLAGWLVARALSDLATLPVASTAALAAALPALARSLLLRLVAVLVLLGLLDLLWARHRHLAGLRMTREEVMREQRDDEGDPLVRQERRRGQRAAALAPPLARAAVLVVNPSHLSVAIAHDGRADEAPTVVAKAAGPAAARLRAEARRRGVPIVRDVLLARSLFRLTEVGDAIPEELYQAAAEVLLQVHRRTRGAP